MLKDGINKLLGAVCEEGSTGAYLDVSIGTDKLYIYLMKAPVDEEVKDYCTKYTPEVAAHCTPQHVEILNTLDSMVVADLILINPTMNDLGVSMGWIMADEPIRVMVSDTMLVMN